MVLNMFIAKNTLTNFFWGNEYGLRPFFDACVNVFLVLFLYQNDVFETCLASAYRETVMSMFISGLLCVVLRPIAKALVCINFFVNFNILFIYVLHVCLVHFFFIYLFVVLRFIRAFSLRGIRHYFRWRASKFDLYSPLMSIEQWRFFSVPHILWHGFIMVISEDPWYSYLLPSAWQ